MAQYQHLPIYKTTYELLSKITQVTAGFSKANSSRTERAHHAGQFLDRLQVVELMLRLSKDLRLLSVKQFAEIVSLSDSLGKQAQGWIKSSALLAESK